MSRRSIIGGGISAGGPITLGSGPVGLGADATLTTTKTAGTALADSGWTPMSDKFEVALSLPGDITGSTASWMGTATGVTFTPTVDWSSGNQTIFGGLVALELKASAVNGWDSYGLNVVTMYRPDNSHAVSQDELIGVLSNLDISGGAGATTTIGTANAGYFSANTDKTFGTGVGNVVTSLNSIQLFLGVQTGTTATKAHFIDILAPLHSGTITELVGLNIANLTASGTAYALKTGTGQLSLGDKITTYNALATAGQGLPVILGLTSQKAETGSADANVLTVTPAAAVGTYRVGVAISVASATNGVIAWTLDWTDSNGNAQAGKQMNLTQVGTAAPNVTFTTSAAGNYHGEAIIDVNNAAASIVVKWVGGGTTSAKMTAFAERLN